MRWSICIITVPERRKDLTRIVGILERQIGDKPIEVLVNGKKGTLGEKRQWCVDSAKGEYVSFIDDDDLVAHDYVQSIYPLLLDGVDYIGFQLQLYKDGEKAKPTYHSLRYGVWFENEDAYYRNVSHLNPIKREIAKRGRFDGGFGEDFRWAEQVARYTKTENYVDRPMYFYFQSPKYSLIADKGQ